MRDGIITLKGRVSDFTREMLVKGLLPPNMDEADIKDGKAEEKAINYEGLKPVFELQDYSGYGFEDVNLKVYPGEVLGVAGVVGAGRTELATTIFGRDKVLKGKAILDGKDITGHSTARVLEAGINYVPEDRRLNGLFAISDVAANTTSSLLRDKKMGGFFLNKKQKGRLPDAALTTSASRLRGRIRQQEAFREETSRKSLSDVRSQPIPSW